MTTIYTVNNKVLKNSANDKWLIKKEAPEGLTYNSSNANVQSSGAIAAFWEGPDNPNGCDFNGKTYKVTISEDVTISDTYISFLYVNNSTSPGGPNIFTIPATNHIITAGVYTGQCNANAAGISSGYGKYLCLVYSSPNVESFEMELSKITVQILD